MIKISLLVPFFAPNKEIEDQRREEFRKWCIEVFEKRISELFGVGVKPDYLLAYTDQIDFVDNDFLIKYGGPTPKGLMVRGKLLSLISKIEYQHIDDNYLILIDGSGKIVYDTVFKVLDTLIEGKQVVLGCRPNCQGISDIRKNIEFFENYLLEEKYKTSLPDAQCGCWGVHANVLKSLPLTAQSYEIELDVVSSAIENNLPVCFIPVEIRQEQLPTNFDFKSNFTKLNFLTNKLGLDKYLIKALYEKFKTLHNISLPTEYVNYFEEVPESKYRKKLDCIGKCDKKCDKAYTYKQ